MPRIEQNVVSILLGRSQSALNLPHQFFEPFRIVLTGDTLPSLIHSTRIIHKMYNIPSSCISSWYFLLTKPAQSLNISIFTYNFSITYASTYFKCFPQWNNFPQRHIFSDLKGIKVEPLTHLLYAFSKNKYTYKWTKVFLSILEGGIGKKNVYFRNE